MTPNQRGALKMSGGNNINTRKCKAVFGDHIKCFDSIIEMANHFQVNRQTMFMRIQNNTKKHGWTFEYYNE